jgi:hypothetical protein
LLLPLPFCLSSRRDLLLLFAFALVFLSVIPTLSEAEGEESASRSRSERPFLL